MGFALNYINFAESDVQLAVIVNVGKVAIGVDKKEGKSCGEDATTKGYVTESSVHNVGMTPAGFCNYFKNKTGKTDIPISQIAYTSGYNSVSFFNRTFKKIAGQPPSSNRKQFAVLKE